MALLDPVVPNVGGVILLFRGQLAVSEKTSGRSTLGI